jgi:hypothetical protein
MIAPLEMPQYAARRSPVLHVHLRVHGEATSPYLCGLRTGCWPRAIAASAVEACRSRADASASYIHARGAFTAGHVPWAVRSYLLTVRFSLAAIDSTSLPHPMHDGHQSSLGQPDCEASGGDHPGEETAAPPIPLGSGDRALVEIGSNYVCRMWFFSVCISQMSWVCSRFIMGLTRRSHTDTWYARHKLTLLSKSDNLIIPLAMVQPTPNGDTRTEAAPL